MSQSTIPHQTTQAKRMCSFQNTWIVDIMQPLRLSELYIHSARAIFVRLCRRVCASMAESFDRSYRAERKSRTRESYPREHDMPRVFCLECERRRIFSLPLSAPVAPGAPLTRGGSDHPFRWCGSQIQGDPSAEAPLA
eukprot:4266876-Pyramimonas_sp.AAC.1